MNHDTPRLIYVCTFLIAASVLLMEIALTRVFSVLTWHHFTYMIISIALLGFGAAGSLLTLRGGEDSSYFRVSRISQNAFYYAFSSLVSILLVTRIHFEPLNIAADWTQLLSLVFYYMALAVPFFFAGLTLGSMITVYSRDINRVYFADLLGASLGSLFSVACIQFLGATNTIFLACLMAAVTAFILSAVEGRPTATGFAKMLFFAVCLVAGIYFDPYLVYAPSSKGIFARANAWSGPQAINYSKWHMVARVDVTRTITQRAPTFSGNISDENAPLWEHRLIYQDGAAPTGILKSDGDVKKITFLDNYLQAAPYVLTKNPNVLVIGVGGGIDVLIALYHDAIHVTGVEVNPLTVRAMKEIFAEYSGRIFTRKNIDIQAAEGRHFISSTRELYDVIQLSGVDTFTALSSGAYALAENYLYTVEAISDFWNHLTPGGTLSFSRWVFFPPRETLRLTAIMVEALEQNGIHEPYRHIAIVKGTTWADTLLKKSPFTPEEITQLENWAQSNRFSLIYEPYHDRKKTFDKVIRSDRRAREEFFRQYVYEVRPSTDDKPFFFNYYKWRNVFTTKVSKSGFTTTNFPVAMLTHVLSMSQILILASLGILYPMRKLRSSLFAHTGGFRALAYFSALGLGFIFAEVSLIQKLMVFLGGPTYSLSITLFSILLFSGLGSWFARRLDERIQTVFWALPLAIVILIPTTAAVFHFFIPSWLNLPLPARVIISVLIIAPAGFAMGMPFPLGIRILNGSRPEWIPWAWATNSFMTVFGPLFCIFLSMHFGFQAVFLIASAIYLFGFLTFRPLALHSRASQSIETSPAHQ